MVPCLVILTDV